MSFGLTWKVSALWWRGTLAVARRWRGRHDRLWCKSKRGNSLKEYVRKEALRNSIQVPMRTSREARKELWKDNAFSYNDRVHTQVDWAAANKSRAESSAASCAISKQPANVESLTVSGGKRQLGGYEALELGTLLDLA